VTGKNHFELFGLPVVFDVDLADLTTRYRSLQQQLHPDRHAGGSDAERRLALQLTANLNDAYQTLRDPVRRARYLLSLQDINTNDETDTSMDPEFLMEQMELREALANLRRHEAPLTQLAGLADRSERLMSATTGRFRDAHARGPGGLAEARRAMREMQFLDKLRREISEREEELA